MTRLFTYVVVHDSGFAPNPFHGCCTLATCKPRIRRSAQPGDWVLGSASRAGGGPGHAVFAMRVSETMGFEEYWRDPRFREKRPDLQGISLMGRCGDNIYHRDPATGAWRQEPSYHGAKDMPHDTGVDRVLIGEDYTYWGGDGPQLPSFAGVDVRKQGVGHRCNFPEEVVREFVRWVRGLEDSGLVGLPTDWPDNARLVLNSRTREEAQRSHRPCSGQRRVRRCATAGSGGSARCGSS